MSAPAWKDNIHSMGLYRNIKRGTVYRLLAIAENVSNDSNSGPPAMAVYIGLDGDEIYVRDADEFDDKFVALPQDQEPEVQG